MFATLRIHSILLSNRYSIGVNQPLLTTIFVFLFAILGDLFIDGKVIHRPQFRFSERQQTRTRPRPRYDRRRETMQVERREPMRRGSWTQEGQAVPEQKPEN